MNWRPRSPFVPVGASLLGLTLGLLIGSGSTLSCGESAETCGDCAMEKCSEFIALCGHDADCQCVYDCIADSSLPEIDACLSRCELSERPPGYAELEDCATYGCPDREECGSDNKNPAGEPPSACDYGIVTGAPLSEGSLADCSFDSSLPFDPAGNVLQLESADKNVCVRIERRDDGNIDDSVTWTLLEVRVGTLGAVSLVEDPAAACWYWSHHNFLDLAHAWTGSRHYDIAFAEEGHGGGRYYELRPFEQGPLGPGACERGGEQLKSECDTPISEPIPLFPFNP